jgi:hypothetical protein
VKYFAKLLTAIGYLGLASCNIDCVRINSRVVIVSVLQKHGVSVSTCSSLVALCLLYFVDW